MARPQPARAPRGAPHKAPPDALQRLLAWLRRAGSHAPVWLQFAREQPGSPFGAARQRLIAINMLVVALVLAVLSVVIYLLGASNAQRNTIAQLQYYATRGGQTAAENGGGPPGGQGGDDEHPPRLVPYSPDTPEIFSVVLTPAGTVQFDSDQITSLGVPVVSAAQPVLVGGEESATPVVRAGGHAYQLYVTGVREHDHVEWVVIAGTSLDYQTEQQAEQIRTLAIVYAAVLLVTFLTSVFLTDRGLGPARLAFNRQRQFATAASHELKTPLAVMRSEVELVNGLVSDSLDLLDGGPDALAQARQALEEARSETTAATTEVDFMTRMVQDLLLLARDASDTLAHSWTVVDVRALVDEVTARVRPMAESDGLALRLANTAPSDTEPLWVRGDAGLLRQLLYGLLENAKRYTPTGGSITVTVREEGRGLRLGDLRRRAVIEVRDTGIGIAPQHLTSIFEPFYRAVSTTRPLHGEQHGTGLGLAMAQWIVRAHDGTIGVQSTVGTGTTFTVELPTTHPDATRATQDARTGAEGQE